MISEFSFALSCEPIALTVFLMSKISSHCLSFAVCTSDISDQKVWSRAEERRGKSKGRQGENREDEWSRETEEKNGEER